MVRWTVFAVSLFVGGAAAMTMAGDRPGSFIKYTPVDSSAANPTTIVNRTVVAPAATVSRELAEQPVHPYLLEVQQPGGARVTLDPAKDYNGSPIHKLDENHWILKAQRLHTSLSTPTVMTIGPSERPQTAALGKIEPRAILLKPGVPGNGPQQDNDGKIPAVPEQPEKEKSTKKVASAE